MPFKLKADSENRANKFILDIIENKKVFYMLHPEGGAFICTSNEFTDANQMPAPIIPLWSSQFLPYAKKYADKLEITEINFEEFYHHMLPAMIQDGMILGLNWDQKGFGIETTASEIYELISNSVRAST